MADKVILVDTSVLIDYYRKSDKENSVLVGLVRYGYKFAISVITKYEIYCGATQTHLDFWKEILNAISILPLDESVTDRAVEINASLKKRRKQIDLADLFIAATAVTHNLPVATLNKKHFERVDNLMLL